MFSVDALTDFRSMWRTVAIVALLVVAAVALLACHTVSPVIRGRDVVVPLGSSSMVIRSTAAEAYPDDLPRHTSDRLTSGYGTLVDDLNAGVTTPHHVFCDFAGVARSYTLVFSYSDRAGATVTIQPDCHPSIDCGDGVHTDNIDQVLPAVRRLIGLPPGLR